MKNEIKTVKEIVKIQRDLAALQKAPIIIQKNMVQTKIMMEEMEKIKMKVLMTILQIKRRILEVKTF